MTKVNYNSETNVLSIFDDGQQAPQFRACEYTHETALRNYVAQLRKQVDRLNEWLYDSRNAGAKNWMERRSIADNMLLKMRQINDRLTRKANECGLNELTYSRPNNKINNKQL